MELKAKIKEAKYVSQKDWKLSQNNGENKKPSYRGPNQKLVDKKNLECFNCEKKSYFKSMSSQTKETNKGSNRL